MKICTRHSNQLNTRRYKPIVLFTYPLFTCPFLIILASHVTLQCLLGKKHAFLCNSHWVQLCLMFLQGIKAEMCHRSFKRHLKLHQFSYSLLCHKNIKTPSTGSCIRRAEECCDSRFTAAAEAC